MKRYEQNKLLKNREKRGGGVELEGNNPIINKSKNVQVNAWSQVVLKIN